MNLPDIVSDWAVFFTGQKLLYAGVDIHLPHPPLGSVTVSVALPSIVSLWITFACNIYRFCMMP